MLINMNEDQNRVSLHRISLSWSWTLLNQRIWFVLESSCILSDYEKQVLKGIDSTILWFFFKLICQIEVEDVMSGRI